MSDDGFDVIVVGGGIAGAVAAYETAKAGLATVLIERGNFAGSKNMTGGRLYAHSLEKVFPGFAETAPVERLITNERISMLTDTAATAVDYRFVSENNPITASYSILRSGFDQWLADQAEEAGAEIVYGICVEDLIVRDGKVCGVIADDEELEAKVTILADGANSLLAQKIGLRDEFKPSQMAVCAKELIELPASTIEDRFQCESGEGCATLFVGSPTAGKVGGGFLYTNKESVSLGIVATMSDLVTGTRSVPAMLEALKKHPSVAPLIKGGSLVEYSAHVVPEGGFDMIPRMHGDGVLVVGDSAALAINLGYAVRGMDLAVTSASLAAATVIEAIEKEDTSETALGSYRQKLEESYVLSDMRLYRKFPHFMESTTRLFKEYPELAANVMAHLFTIDGTPAVPLKKAIKPYLSDIGLMTLGGDLWKGMGAL